MVFTDGLRFPSSTARFPPNASCRQTSEIFLSTNQIKEYIYIQYHSVEDYSKTCLCEETPRKLEIVCICEIHVKMVKLVCTHCF